MKSIYNSTDNEELLKRIHLLTPESKALWGKMNVSQMMSHCIAPIDFAFGNTTIRSNFFMQLIGRLFKNKILNSTEFQKNSPTAKEFLRTNDHDFKKTKDELIQKVNEFTEKGPKAIKHKKHPFFGKMTNEEWDKLHYMHLNHHLKQFGV